MDAIRRRKNVFDICLCTFYTQTARHIVEAVLADLNKQTNSGAYWNSRKTNTVQHLCTP